MGSRGRSPSSGRARLRASLRTDLREQGHLLTFLVRWLVLGSVVGALAGASSAVFLFGLRWVMQLRADDPQLLYALPLGGLAVGLLYHHFGGRSAAGNNLILDEIHGMGPAMADAAPAAVPDAAPAGIPDAPPAAAPDAVPDAAPREGRRASKVRYVPRRMAPLVLVGTWVTHLFGGSAGREGTAIQMAGSLADGFSRLVRIDTHDRALLLTAAVSGGFASVFSVPIAGFVFGLEVRSLGRIRYDAIVPALSAAVVGNLVFHAIDLPHDATPAYPLAPVALTPGMLGRVALAALAFGLAARIFSSSTEGLKRVFARIGYPPLRPMLGGLLVVGLFWLVGTDAYLGLSLPLIDASLTGADVVWYAFALKLAFTALTLGSGFQGGEVTPLFVIGATLGAALAVPLGVPVELLASVGFVAVFAAATNTPLACTIMGLELFGTGGLPYLAVGCVVAYVFSAHRGIYEAQRIDTPKSPLLGGGAATGSALRDQLQGGRSHNAPQTPTPDERAPVSSRSRGAWKRSLGR